MVEAGCFVAVQTEWLLLRNPCEFAPFQPLSVIANEPKFRDRVKQSLGRLLQANQTDLAFAMTVRGVPPSRPETAKIYPRGLAV